MRILERMFPLRIECFRQVMDLKRKLSEKISEKTAIPEEVLADAAVIQVRGKRSVSVENHKGVRVYEQEHIQIAVKRGCVHIYGLDLTIARMTRKTLEIRGKLDRLDLE